MGKVTLRLNLIIGMVEKDLLDQVRSNKIKFVKV